MKHLKYDQTKMAWETAKIHPSLVKDVQHLIPLEYRTEVLVEYAESMNRVWLRFIGEENLGLIKTVEKSLRSLIKRELGRDRRQLRFMSVSYLVDTQKITTYDAKELCETLTLGYNNVAAYEVGNHSMRVSFCRQKALKEDILSVENSLSEFFERC